MEPFTYLIIALLGIAVILLVVFLLRSEKKESGGVPETGVSEIEKDISPIAQEAEEPEKEPKV